LIDRRKKATTFQPLNIPRKYTATVRKASVVLTLRSRNWSLTGWLFWTAKMPTAPRKTSRITPRMNRIAAPPQDEAGRRLFPS